MKSGERIKFRVLKLNEQERELLLRELERRRAPLSLEKYHLDRTRKILINGAERGSFSSYSNEPLMSLDELLSLPTKRFLEQAYKKILQRDPDEMGFKAYLDKLLQGKLIREEILCRMIFSKEGRKKRAELSLRDLLRLLICTGMATIPLFGQIYRKIFGKIYLERVLYNLEEIKSELENRVYSLELFLGEIANKVSFIMYEEEVADVWIETFSFEDLSSEGGVYDRFERVFRGSYANIRDSLEKYVNLLENYFQERPWLKGGKIADLGFGRGEFLELLVERGFAVTGCEIREEAYGKLKEKGFEVVLEDALNFIIRSEEQFSAICAFQVIEHLEFRDLLMLIEFSMKKLLPGGILLFETVNPWAFEAFPRFYLDYTHVRPIPPELLAYILWDHGFREIRAIHSEPLKKMAKPSLPRKYLYLNYGMLAVKPSGKSHGMRESLD